MKPTLLLRIASIFVLLHFLGHTLGGMMSAPSHGPEEVAVIDSMKSHIFNFMGSLRSYWDFHQGFGFSISLNLLAQTVLFWLLGSLAKDDSRRIRPILALFFFAWLTTAVLSWRYFFIAPMVLEIIVAACLGLAWIACGKQVTSPAVLGNTAAPKA